RPPPASRRGGHIVSRTRSCARPLRLYNGRHSFKDLTHMRLASFKVNGRPSYGAVTDGGIIDLARRLPKYPTLLDVFRAKAIGEARAAATGPGDHRLAEVELLPPIIAPEKIICVGINYPERATEYKD